MVRADRDLQRVAIVMLALVGVFVVPAAVSVAVGGIDGFDGGRLDLRFDRTVPEFFGYAQLLVTVVALDAAGRREQVRFPLALAAIATMLLIDDALASTRRSVARSTPCVTVPMSVRCAPRTWAIW